ncbi:DUF4972 domain-containing protein [Bacteroidaceae bacterium HV4-6-C5C]|nr:DUF4972 domain-containing protein [Bacteroidaceae bacterium HV4-6-C5C]
MNVKYSMLPGWHSICALIFIFLLAACSEEEHNYTATPEINDTYITQLDDVIKQMTALQQNSDYGNKTGQYPAESRSILTDGIDDANRAILLIKYQNPSPSESEKKRYLDNAEKAIDKFKASVRTEDAETIPAELFVDGKSNQSYIDFGRSKDYTVFGDAGNQSFTVELWVKIKEHGPNDNSMFLSTFYSNSTAQWRNGWMMYWRNANGGIYRTTWGGILSSNRWGLWEPSFAAPADNEWQYFVFVYSDKGLDGNPNLRGKLYLNGALVSTQENGNASEVYNSSDYANYDKPMTGFCRWVNDNTMEEGFSGYMKNIRIWKEAKDATYVQSAFNGQVSVTGKENNLVAAWNFTEKPLGANDEVLDLTGKHTAQLIGTYKWERK